MTYTASYFDKWYRSGDRVHAPGDRRRTVRMVLGLGEFMLGRPVRTVVDIGAGEGHWRQVLRRERPTVRYTGIDPSTYAVTRFGARRNIVLGTLGDLPAGVARRRFDLVVCAGMLNYIALPEMQRGLADIARMARGVAFLELFTSRDDVYGDSRGRRRASTYRRLLRDAGFRQCGPHCYVGPQFEGALVELETC